MHFWKFSYQLRAVFLHFVGCWMSQPKRLCNNGAEEEAVEPESPFPVYESVVQQYAELERERNIARVIFAPEILFAEEFE